MTQGREIHARDTRFGRYLEDFEVGDVYVHWPGKTITEADDHLFCMITMNHHPLHTDAHYAETETQFGRNVVVGNLVYSLVLGMSVPDVSGKAIANLEVESLKHAAPTFHGDTIYAKTQVLEVRASQSKPDRGVVTVETTGWNQRDERLRVPTPRADPAAAGVSGPLTLYDHAWSTNSLKVRFLLAELGLPYTRVHVPAAQPRPAEYVALQPYGTTPFLLDGDFALGESNTMLRYLADREARDDLYPRDLRGRARVDAALDAWSTQVRPAFWGLEEVALYATGDAEVGGGRWEDADQGAIAARMPALEDALGRWERTIEGDGTLFERFTIADCASAPVLFRSRRLPVQLERWPKVAAMRDWVERHPSFLAAEPKG